MALIRWEPATELNTIQQEMNRLFNTFFDQPANSTAGARRWIPPVDLEENGDNYVLRADLPGLSEDDIKIEFESNVLTISGERKSEQERNERGYHRVERAHGSFSRSLTLPEGVNPDAIQAKFDRGVLEVTVPKPPAEQPRRVSISVGDSKESTPEVEASAQPVTSAA
ncbi:MAG: Hsp20/alpha crystallin family protein [Solirubrobacterales bacterium]|nr:Hsp20/alpha crystallin family protein [Solirubrobacterales bacterium]